jgi:hypothetical protein
MLAIAAAPSPGAAVDFVGASGPYRPRNFQPVERLELAPKAEVKGALKRAKIIPLNATIFLVV